MINRSYAAASLCAIALVSFSFVKKSKPSAKKNASLVFPVAGKKNSIGSFWGEPRENGERNHEGIDIFATKGTPVVAVADGEILSKNTTSAGGNILWLQPKGKLWTAYYAHLDKQLVKEGEYVRKGQVIGTVGNTGNAGNTAAHLHFGIYTWGGAVNPYPIIKNASKLASPILSNKQPELLAAKAQPKEKAGEKNKKREKQKNQSLAKNRSRKPVEKSRRIRAERSARYYVINAGSSRSQVDRKWKKVFTDKRGFVCRIGN